MHILNEYQKEFQDFTYVPEGGLKQITSMDN